MNDNKQAKQQAKQNRRNAKRMTKRHATAEEVIFIFEKVLAGWKPIRIFNTIVQTNPQSEITKKKTEVIATGNCRVTEAELPCPERYLHYLELREQVNQMHKK